MQHHEKHLAVVIGALNEMNSKTTFFRKDLLCKLIKQLKQAVS